MQFIRKFLPIGQGGFHVEQHIPDRKHEAVFTVVYDCGSKPLPNAPKKLFLDKVNHSLSPRSVINILFISHFHDDHVNGISVLKYKFDIKVVVIPFLTEDEIDVIRVENFLLFGTKDVELLDDPEGYFGNKVIIIRVRPIYNTTDPGISEFVVEINENDKPKFPESSILVSGTEDSHIIDSGTPLQITLQGCTVWRYIPFNFDSRNRVLPFYNELIKSRILRKELKDIDVIERKKRVLRGIYDKIDGGLNGNSMIVCSHHFDTRFNMDVHQQGSGFNNCCNYFGFTLNEACLYLGDINLNEQNYLKELKNRLAFVLDFVSILQVPHHGSGLNFDSELFKQGMLSFVSFGTDNGYGHPASYVMDWLILKEVSSLQITDSTATCVRLIGEY